MSPDLLGVVCAAVGVGLLVLALLQGRSAFWLYIGAVLLAGGLLIIAFTH
jgi:hypothetical protein